MHGEPYFQPVIRQYISQSNVESVTVHTGTGSFVCDSKFRMPTIFYFPGTGAYLVLVQSNNF